MLRATTKRKAKKKVGGLSDNFCGDKPCKKCKSFKYSNLSHMTLDNLYGSKNEN